MIAISKPSTPPKQWRIRNDSQSPRLFPLSPYRYPPRFLRGWGDSGKASNPMDAVEDKPKDWHTDCQSNSSRPHGAKSRRDGYSGKVDELTISQEISAGVLREIGIPVPDNIPDCAVTDNHSWLYDFDDVSLDGNEVKIGGRVIFLSPFRWVTAKYEIQDPPIEPKDCRP